MKLAYLIIALSVVGLIAQSGLRSPAYVAQLRQPSAAAGGGCDALDDSTLKGYWNLNSDLTDSKGANDLTDHGTITFTAAKLGNGGSFNGTSQYASIADNTDLSTGANTFSSDGWFYADDVASFHIVWGKGSEWLIYILSGTMYFQTRGGADLSAGTIGSGQWYHCAVVYDNAAGTKTFYTNGVQAATVGSVTAPNDTADAFEIGSGSGGAGKFDGLIDEVAFWKGKALTGSEVSSRYNSGSACRPSGL